MPNIKIKWYMMQERVTSAYRVVMVTLAHRGGVVGLV